MKKYVSLALLLLFCFSRGPAQQLEERLHGLLDSVYQANKEAIGILVHVESPKDSLSWTKAFGVSDTVTKAQLLVDQPVLIASNTKPYVAAASLRFVEEGKFTLDQTIENLLSLPTTRLLKGNGYKLDKIQVKHLLSHTSGIRDYVDEDYLKWVDEHPQYKWKQVEQIKRSVELGPPLDEPGKSFKYGDINYLLLAEIFERFSKRPFYGTIRSLNKFEALGLNHTWFKDLETYPSHTLPLAHQYADKYGWDSYDLDPSWDLYGGGGMASTVKDAALFFQYLFEGKIIEDQELLEKMHSYVLPKEESNYCLGVRLLDFGKYRLYYHGGWWGTDVIYCPETGSSVAVFTLQKGKRNQINPFLGKTITEMLLGGNSK
ncbi:MAG: serine hydrolase domain-containing protein [Bacteroidota bacterium]